MSASIEAPLLVVETEKIEHQHGHGHGGSGFKSLLAGAVGGTFEVLTDHPIDLVKVRMQTAKAASGSSVSSATVPKNTVPGIISHVLRQDGVMGLYRGASIRVATLMPATAISFWGLDIGKQLVARYHGEVSMHHLSVSQVTMAGAFSGIPVTLFATPSERIKCLLQVQNKSPSGAKPLYKGPLECGRYLFQTGGFESLYRGLGITLARNIPGYAAWFGSYEWLKQNLFSGRESVFATFMCGGLSGSFSWAVMIPFDGIKSRIQTSSTPISVGKAFTELTAKNGYRALFRGLVPAVLIAFPANAACFLGMECAWKGLTMMEKQFK